MAEPTDDLGMTSLDERVDAYLEGQLSRAEARRLEAELTEPAAAQALAEALALRELLAAPSGDDAVPDGLVARIEARLGVDEHTALLLRPRREREKAARRPRFAAVKNALGGFAWSWRGATMAAAPTSPAGDGLRTLSYAAA
ncbi:MAG: hypothetical protein KC635_12670, partial [Myxococcales bacterium]|nr:hypothetical protein [Myxococcales bacterium]